MNNRIREELHGRGFTIGSWLNLASPLAAELMASIGFGWLCVDAEHSPVGLSDLATLLRAIESRGATPIVRVPDHDPHTIARVLDAGALGIVAPHVSTADQARRIAHASRYPPRGHRSSGTGRAVTLGGDYAQRIDEEVVVIAQVEDREGVNNAAQIMAVEGIDIGLLGPKDLSLEMGVEMGSAEHELAMARLREACEQSGKPGGIPVHTGKALRQRHAEGFTFFDLASDFRLLEAQAVAELNAALGKAGKT